MIDQLAAGVGLALVTFGVFALFSAALGLFRLRGALDRVHAAAMADTLAQYAPQFIDALERYTDALCARFEAAGR